jgi:hypothetical protein
MGSRCGARFRSFESRGLGFACHRGILKSWAIGCAAASLQLLTAELQHFRHIWHFRPSSTLFRHLFMFCRPPPNVTRA